MKYNAILIKLILIRKFNKCRPPGSRMNRWSKEHSSQSIKAKAIYNQETPDLDFWKLFSCTKRKHGVVHKAYNEAGILHRGSVSTWSRDIKKHMKPSHFEASLFFNVENISTNILNLVTRKLRMAIFVKKDSKYRESIVDHIVRPLRAIVKRATGDYGKKIVMHNHLQANGLIAKLVCNPGSS